MKGASEMESGGGGGGVEGGAPALTQSAPVAAPLSAPVAVETLPQMESSRVEKRAGSSMVAKVLECRRGSTPQYMPDGRNIQ